MCVSCLVLTSNRLGYLSLDDDEFLRSMTTVRSIDDKLTRVGEKFDEK